MRKWGFISLEKRPVEQHPSAALGTDTHKQLETWLSGGQIDYTRPSGYIAASGLQHLPSPNRPGMLLESKFRFQSRRGIWYTGYRDVFIPGDVRENGRPLVIDHKTTSGLAWAKTTEDLKTDPQAVIYAYSAPADKVDLRWVYYQTKGARKSLPVDITLTREHVVQEFEQIEVLTAEPLIAIVDLYKRGRLRVLEHLPYNPDTCDKYGGCPFKPVCNLGPGDRLRAIMNRKNPSQQKDDLMGLIDSLRQNAPTQAPPPPHVDAINPPADSAAPAVAIVPPVLDPAFAAQTAAPLKGAAKSAATRRAKKEAEKASAAERTETLPGILDVAVQAGKDLVKEQVTADEKALNEPGYTLYIDCAPDSFLFTAEDLLYAPARQAVAEKSGVPDYRMIQFGAGPGYLAVAVEDLLKEFKGSHLVVSTQCQETHACLAVLVKYAAQVVRATR